jgi:hypothetical protein
MARYQRNKSEKNKHLKNKRIRWSGRRKFRSSKIDIARNRYERERIW